MQLKPRYIILFVVLAAFVSLCSVVVVKNHDADYRALFGRHTRILSPEIPSSASFAGEEVPLDLYYVREAFEREIFANSFLHSTTIMVFKRANRWFPVIEPILKENGIPDDFKFLAVAESNLVNVTSAAGAEGYWQFVKPTGQKYGLEISEKVDERYHMEKATRAACAFIREAREKSGSWTLAAACYNRGTDGILRALENQKVNNYYDLYLNDETSRYVFRILAIKEIYNHPARYGFYLRQQDFYPPIPTREVTVDSAIADLPAFARAQSSNYRILRELNPWIRNYSLPNPSKKSYTLRFPLDGAISWQKLRKNMPESATFFHDTLTIDELR